MKNRSVIDGLIALATFATLLLTACGDCNGDGSDGDTGIDTDSGTDLTVEDTVIDTVSDPTISDQSTDTAVDPTEDADLHTPDITDEEIAQPGPTVLDGSFRYGFEYTVVYPFRVDLATALVDLLASDGVLATKTGPIIWNNIEPNEPTVVDVHTYNWNSVDRLVELYQTAGFTDIILVLRCRSDWATDVPPVGGGIVPAGMPPIDGPAEDPDRYWRYYAAWVQAFAERYDADGVDDMPGLLFPVRRFEVETEAQHAGFWQGDEATPNSLPNYSRLLSTAAEALRSAHPETIVILAGMVFNDVEDDFPSEETFRARLVSSEFIESQAARLDSMLLLCDDFDEVEFHALHGYTGVITTTHRIRLELERAGCEDVPIWVGDSTSVPPLALGYTGFNPNEPDFSGFAPFLAWSDGVELLNALAVGTNPDHEVTEEWYRWLQTVDTVKRSVVAIAEGASGINIYSILDGPLFPWADWRYQGFAEVIPDLDQVNPRPPLEPYQQVTTLLTQAQTVERIDLSEQDPSDNQRHSDIYVYRFEGPEGPFWFAWYDRLEETDEVVNPNPYGHGPGETWPTLEVTIPVDVTEVSLTPFPGDDDDISVVSATDGAVTITLGTTPFLIEPATHE